MAKRTKRKAKTDYLGKFIGIIVFLAIFLALNVIFTVPALYFYYSGYMSYNSLMFVSDATLSMSFSLSVLCYFVFYKKQSLGSMAASVGLKGKGVFGINRILIGVLLFIVIFVLELIVGIISVVTNTPINSNVNVLFASAPIWFYVFTSLIAPINEEILFRGFLVPRIGIILSALIFAAGHVTYNSSFGIEVIAAFIFGLLAGYVYKRTNSLYPSIIAHILVNTLTILLTFMVLA